MSAVEISVQEARRLALICQGLHQARPFGTGINAVRRCVQQLGHVQIDTISVIRRSHHHCLWTRVPSYREQHLDKLQRNREIFEYWAHAAAYLPMSDYRYSRPYMQAIADGQRHWRAPDRKAMRAVLDRIRIDGPLMARDFEHGAGRADDWGWNWKPAKVALEQLFIEGQLMVSHREGFQKVYDLPERVLPAGLDTSMPSAGAFARHLIVSTLRAHGLATAPEFGYLRKGVKQDLAQSLRELQDAGEVIPLTVGGVSGVWFSTPDLLDRLGAARVSRRVHLLSPFDNAVIKRKRIQALFDSDYQIECFVPAARRRYGYYCLPILYGTEIIGRLDPKADRRTRTLHVRSLHLEKPPRDRERFMALLGARLEQLAAFNECERVAWDQPSAG